MKYLSMILALACLSACGDKDDDTGEDVVDTAEESETAAE